MARKLNVSKAGFYWYFKEPGRFQQALAQRLQAVTEAEWMAWTAAQWPWPERAARLYESVYIPRAYPRIWERLRREPDLHPALQTWVAQTESRQQEYLTTLFAMLGWTPQDAAARARLLWHLYWGFYLLGSGQPDAQRQEELTKATHSLLHPPIVLNGTVY
jgi:AcrR family transcriptional regulator